MNEYDRGAASLALGNLCMAVVFIALKSNLETVMVCNGIMLMFIFGQTIIKKNR